MDSRQQLIVNGYSVGDSDGLLHCANPKRPHSHVGVVRLMLDADTNQNRANAEAVLKVALAEAPLALVGRNPRGDIVALFRCDKVGEGMHGAPGIEPTGGAQRKFDGLTVTVQSRGQAVEVEFYKWDGGRSPLNTSRDLLPWIYADQADAVMAAALDTCGHAPTPPTEFEIAVAARKARIAAGLEEAPRGALDDVAAADEALVRNANPTLRGTDGVFGALVAAARERIQRRKQSA